MHQRVRPFPVRILAEHPEHPDFLEIESAIADLNRAAGELLMTKP
jgi:hypothetical protein